MNWHTRYLQQATWTYDLRRYLFKKAELENARHILEVGCGTGAILRGLDSPAALHGLDLNPAALAQCQIHAPNVTLTQANGLALPYPNQMFDIVYCHYFLLWVDNPLQAVREMKRVTKEHGHILALAEPDYESRVDKPDELKLLGKWQKESLKRQGANPSFGSRLAETFFQAGIQIHETVTIQSAKKNPTVEEREMEWAVIEADLAGSVSEAEIQKMKLLDERAWKHGDRVLHVPTYFVWGQI
jgi:ubiquinone/menaquinone biosynthesis C-methylase UbiE